MRHIAAVIPSGTRERLGVVRVEGSMPVPDGMSSRDFKRLSDSCAYDLTDVTGDLFWSQKRSAFFWQVGNSEPVFLTEGELVDSVGTWRYDELCAQRDRHVKCDNLCRQNRQAQADGKQETTSQRRKRIFGSVK